MTVAKFTHVAIFSLVIIGCLAEIVTSGILVGDFTKLPDYSAIATRTRYLLFCGLWTFLFSTIYVVGLSTAPDHLLFSVASHLIWLGVTIVLFVSGAAALTTEIKGQHFPHQQRLEILQGFAWADSILLGLALLLILGIGIGRRNGLSGNLLGGP
ncbi:hypothetical protein MJO28_004751 [Puccinia striiformis f. sp. tritici]|uniref:MARVEL domain-containing protein n=2 Tax=Puccinia striiformis f. sp. tritici TaxID=168172 RepID=A0A0L0VMM5_9BASI|nr:hypothetical protein Pst134EA_008995 [Puccinia striiformis f. sp. tritici]KAI9609601.1 hypothetical protein H4Q26_007561 [Puccinia striiformis f. sp. tritici PST-130]KNF00524.1 hypothetical protein PSTG_06216 [Puccinia striiformis f. sp. tritici PST-78]KAH9457694.1 hypothetical protein Pst134EB_010014 [Puccinia striiformis f. sp. tritici]KAH9468451.1 hypothetical protein Pst134EA_008995 [Puccinia striiformis f. sp. tritici]KAI7954351.1 hypothetical protein MJO28_004751 [Puccinia striiformis